jgi:hypothetical protein
MKEIALKMQKSCPKRATSDTSDTPGVHPGEGRAARTVALQKPAIQDSFDKNQFQS